MHAGSTFVQASGYGDMTGETQQALEVGLTVPPGYESALTALLATHVPDASAAEPLPRRRCRADGNGGADISFCDPTRMCAAPPLSPCAPPRPSARVLRLAPLPVTEPSGPQARGAERLGKSGWEESRTGPRGRRGGGGLSSRQVGPAGRRCAELPALCNSA